VFFSGVGAQPMLPLGTSEIQWSAIDVNGNAAQATQTVTVVASDTPDACCSGGQQLVLGNAFPNVFVFPLPAELCVFGKGSVDTLITGPGADYLSGGSGLDVLVTGSAGDVCTGGAGSDVITLPVGSGRTFGGSGHDVIEMTGGGTAHGNDGDDHLITIFGDHVLYPGAGRDVVTAGPGNDTIVVLDACEIEPFEVLEGGFGTDTLRTPIPVAEIFARGAVVVGVENVVVDATARHLSECFQ
jgi:Ca2+-binding RTX toxin-like protein